jgi:SAM-dependent methyltransferase
VNIINLVFLRFGSGSEILAGDLVVLDIGSGAGYYRDLIVGHNNNYIAVDPYSESSDVNAPADNLPFENDSADVILCFDVLQHLDDPELALHEFKRVLKKSGKLISTQAFLYPECDASDRYRWSIEGIKIFLNKAGFDVIDAKRRGGITLAAYCFFVWCIQHSVPRTGKWRISSEGKLRRFLIYFVSSIVLMTRPIGHIALFADLIFRIKGIYMGTLVVGVPRK